MAIDKRFLFYYSEAGFLSDKNKGNIDDESIAFISEGGKRAIYTHGVYFSPDAFVVGTQTSSTNAFTGEFNEIDKLYDGLSIKYWIPFNGTSSEATLNLTINGTATGAIPVYIKGTTRFTNHIGAYNVLHLTYRENVGNIAKGWWVLGSYGDASDGNTTYSFTSGTDGSFKVKPSNGAEQTISVGKPEEAGRVSKNFTIQINSGTEEDVSFYEYNGSAARYLKIKSGNNIKFDTEDGELVISGAYNNATQSAAGLMSSTDKKKIDSIKEGANKYEHPKHTEASLGFYKVEVDAEGHVKSVSGVTKSDITSLGIPEADTHYSSKNVVGSSTSTNNTTTALTNGNVYINSVENNKVTSSHKISGSGNTTVKTDASGNIEINSPTTIAWGSVTGKPSTFAPSAHNHVVSEITDLKTKKLTFNGTGYLIYTSETTLPTFYAPGTLGSNGQVLKSDGTKVYWAKDNNDDTKNTTGTTEKSNTKLFLAGATSQGANPQTYSNTNVYIGSNNCLYSNGTKVSVEGHTHNYLSSLPTHTHSYTELTGGAGTAGKILVSNGSGAPSWQDCGGKVKSTTAAVAIGTSWGTLLSATNLGTLCDSTVGTYAIQIYGPSSIGISSGVFTWNSANSEDANEILLHRTGASTSIYLRMATNRTLQIAGSAAVSSSTITIKVKRLI